MSNDLQLVQSFPGLPQATSQTFIHSIKLKSVHHWCTYRHLSLFDAPHNLCHAFSRSFIFLFLIYITLKFLKRNFKSWHFFRSIFKGQSWNITKNKIQNGKYSEDFGAVYLERLNQTTSFESSFGYLAYFEKFSNRKIYLISKLLGKHSYIGVVNEREKINTLFLCLQHSLESQIYQYLNM